MIPPSLDGIVFADRRWRDSSIRVALPAMTLKLIAMAAGVLALFAGVVIRSRVKRTAKVTAEPVSSDWLAHARARADDPL
jgi:hypothetical protein